METPSKTDICGDSENVTIEFEDESLKEYISNDVSNDKR